MKQARAAYAGLEMSAHLTRQANLNPNPNQARAAFCDLEMKVQAAAGGGR